MKRILLLTLLSLTVLPSDGASFNSCKSLYDGANYGSAVNCFAERVKSNPNDVQSQLWYGASLYYDKQYTKSYQQYKYVSQKFPNTPAGDYAKKEAQKVYNRINSVNNAKSNDKGNYISELDYTSKWTQMPIRVWIQPSQYSNSAKRAFALWQSQTGGAVKFMYVSNQSTANIRVTFTDKITNPVSGEQIGKTSLKFSGKKNYSADIQLLQRTSTNQMCSDKQIYYSALHEVGHALGISGHSKSTNDIMYYNTNTNSLGLSNRDINTVKAIYGK